MNKSSFPEEPLWAMISQDRGLWTVHLRNKDSYVSAYRQGYGELPIEYNGLPIIDCSAGSFEQVLKFTSNPLECEPREATHFGKLTLEQYLTRCINVYGLKVINFKQKEVVASGIQVS